MRRHRLPKDSSDGRRGRLVSILLVPLIVVAGLGLAGCLPGTPNGPTCTITATHQIGGAPGQSDYVTVQYARAYSSLVIARQDGVVLNIYSPPWQVAPRGRTAFDGNKAAFVAVHGFEPFYFVDIGGHRTCSSQPADAGCAVAGSPLNTVVATPIHFTIQTNRPNQSIDLALGQGSFFVPVDKVTTNDLGVATYSLDTNGAVPDTYAFGASLTAGVVDCAVDFTLTS